MTATLVFIHGRGQEGKDPAELETAWRAALAAGAAAAGAPRVEGVPSVFPYYGDVLAAQAETQTGPILLESLADDDTIRLQRELVDELARRKGAKLAREESVDGLLSLRMVQKSLDYLARHTRVDQAIIARHLRDVATYLTTARKVVLATVRAAIPPNGDLVVVSHSLGTVVARDLLDNDHIRARTTHWITAGSPLGLDAIKKNLHTPGAANPDVDWLTAYDVNDIVALGHPLKPTWGPPLLDIEVDNGEPPHSIESYLRHREVAGPITIAAN